MAGEVLAAAATAAATPPTPELACCIGEAFPTEDRTETVVFWSFYEKGFGLPSGALFRGLLHYCGLEATHLKPNSIMQIKTFIHLCEGFLGIAPHFNLWRALYHLWAYPNKDMPDVVGGAAFSLRQGEEYPEAIFKDSNKGAAGKAVNPPAGLALPAADVGTYSSNSSIGSESDDVVEVSGPTAGAVSTTKKQRPTRKVAASKAQQGGVAPRGWSSTPPCTSRGEVEAATEKAGLTTPKTEEEDQEEERGRPPK
ncbi:retrotransposon protein, putative, Ty3-gypsy subclass [Panicum miliaceum]|uniref:Retrotransposon protein, putative, Ty3-gypsy subclass n=1 Tax=Panicum miliaceum TaxID=4540 RepID=A0A3L6RG99_PANMI|nr:retrotransposon protein, putative, Ty3-gypsy subclass [Panicum miliaceum]